MFWNFEKQQKKKKEQAEAMALLEMARLEEKKKKRLAQLESDLVEILAREKKESLGMSGLSAWLSNDLFGVAGNGTTALKYQIMKIAREEIDRVPIPIVYEKPKKRK